MAAFGGILLKNSWLEKRTCMRVSYFEARSLKKNSSQLAHAFICENLVRKGSKIVFQQYWGQSGRSIRLENDILAGIYRPKAIIGSLPQSSKMPRQDHWVESRLSSLACKVLSIGDSILFAVLCRTQAGASSDQSVESSEGRGDLREFCVFESCIVMHCGAG